MFENYFSRPNLENEVNDNDRAYTSSPNTQHSSDEDIKSHQKDPGVKVEDFQEFLQLQSDGPAGKLYHFFMGVYGLSDEKFNNYPVYRLVDGTGFIYVDNDGDWSVFQELDPTGGSIYNLQQPLTSHPPATGWTYVDTVNEAHDVDPSVTVVPIDASIDSSHLHCLTCYAGGRCEYSRCETMICSNSCRATYHSCKEDEHQLLCPLALQQCGNKEFGCEEMVFRKERVNHFKQCKAYQLADVVMERRGIKFIKELKKRFNKVESAPLYLKLQSQGGAGDRWSEYMGVYKITDTQYNGFSVYQRMGSQHYIYVSLYGWWKINDEMHPTEAAMIHRDRNPTPSFPPSQGWQYVDKYDDWSDDPTLRLEKTDVECEAALLHLKSTGAIINFPIDDLQDFLFFPDILANSFRVFFRHDLRDQVMKKLPRPTTEEEYIEHNFENEAEKIFELGLISKNIYEGLYEHLREKDTIPLGILVDLIERLGIGLETENGGLLIPSLAANNMEMFPVWFNDRYEDEDMNGNLLQAEFYFDRGAFTIGMSEVISVALEKTRYVKFLKVFREKIEDRKAGVVYLGFGAMPNYKGKEVFIMEEEKFENEKIFRRRSVTVILKAEINEESCQLFLELIEETKMALNRIQKFSNFPEDVIYSVRIPCNKCLNKVKGNTIVGRTLKSDKQVPGYFDWTMTARTGSCLPRYVHKFEKSHQVLDKYLSQDIKVDTGIRSNKRNIPFGAFKDPVKTPEKNDTEGSPSKGITIAADVTATSGDINIGDRVNISQNFETNVNQNLIGQQVNLHVNVVGGSNPDEILSSMASVAQGLGLGSGGQSQNLTGASPNQSTTFQSFPSLN